MAQKLTKSDLDYLKANFRTRSNRQMAEDLKIDKSAVVHALNALKLQRTREEELKLKTGTPNTFISRKTSESPSIALPSTLSNPFHKVVLVILFFLVFLLYADSFKNEFVWDDEILVVQNNYIKSASKIPQFFTENTFKGGDRDSNFWRPVQLLSYFVDYKIVEWVLKFRADHAKAWNPAFGFHLSNTLYHALVCLLVYLYVFLIFRRKDLALITSMIYAVHPIHTEAVTYIAGRADSQAAFFILGALCLYLKYTDSKKGKGLWMYLGSVFSFILALMSKEMAIMLPAYMLLTDLVTFQNQKKKSWINRVLRYVPYLIILGLYLYLRSTILDFANIPLLKEQPAQKIPVFLRFITFTRTLLGFVKNPDTHLYDLGYLWLLIFPFNLHMERGTPYAKSFYPENSDQAAYFVCFAGFLILLGLTFYLYRKSKPLFFGLAFFLTALIPFMDIMPLNANAAEHWLYLPSIGIFILMGQIMISLLRLKTHFSIQDVLKKIIFSPIPIYLIYCGILTSIRNLDWKDELTIWKKTADLSNSSHIHGNLGVAYGRKGDMNAAKEEFIKALRIQFNYPEAHNNLGVILMMEFQRDHDKNKLMTAKKEFELALQSYPNYSNAYKNLGDVYASMNNPEEAKKLWRKALEVNPYQEDARQRLLQQTTDTSRQS